MGNKRNFSLSLWDHKDNFLCLLKSANSDFEGQSFQENIVENINGEKTLTLSVPMYIFNYDLESNNKFERNNICWDYIHNEQKIRYIEYDELFNNPIRIQEFVLKHFTESRDGEQKIANCECESLAVYELGKVGWSINFDTDYITPYEMQNPPEDLLTIDYWMRKIFYYETNLGRVSTSSECVALMQGLQLRNSEGYPIDSQYTSDSTGNLLYNIIDEPSECTTTEFEEYYNPSGWSWEVNSVFTNNPAKHSVTTNLYEEPVIGKYVEITPGNYVGFSYQKNVEQGDEEKRLLPHPIEKKQDGTYDNLMYVTNIKKRLVSLERSNIYNAIQTISEVFEVWPHFVYNYNEQGKITERKIIFKTEAVNEKIKFDFSYGKNIINCSRETDSNDLVTKLIVTDVESQLDNNNILSIRQATPNPTGENYLYNFDYFYELGSMTRLTPLEKMGEEEPNHSDEFYYNQYAAKLRKFNDEISNIQKSLIPLYDRQNSLQSDLSVEEGSLNGYMDNIQSIENKLSIIPPDSQVLKSWSDDSNQYNHVGEIKTFSMTTKGAEEYIYINFGRDDVIYNSLVDYNIEYQNAEGVTVTTSLNAEGYIPRLFNYGDWHTGSTALPDNDVSNFTLLSAEGSSSSYYGTIEVDKVEPDYSELGNNTFIKGIYFTFADGKSGSLSTYARIRYKYAPNAYYYLLIQDYWDKLNNTSEKIDGIKEQLQDINNKILVKELTLNGILNDKRKLILQFERKYKPFIREGYWEPEEYQSQLIGNKLIATTTVSQDSGFEGLIIDSSKLSELNLNDSLNNYSYYINLGRIQNIDIDSIKMTTFIRLPGSNIEADIPRYRGKDYEIFIDNNNDLIIGIAPELIDYYDKHKIHKYECKLQYNNSNGEIQEENVNWTHIEENNDPIVIEKSIYITNDNILTDSILVYGRSKEQDKENELIPENLLEAYTDYDYNFDYIGYIIEGNNKIRVDLNNQTTYSSDVYYDYITKIKLKNTNKVNEYDEFIVTYNTETTLEYLYNDAVSTSKKYSTPQVTYSLSVLDLSSLNDYKNYKPLIGQKVPIYDKEMGFNGYNGFITSIQRELESPENTEITIATFETKFEDIFQKLTATMADIQYNSNSIYKTVNSFNEDGSIRTDIFQKSLENNALKVNLGINNDISITEKDGITLTDRDSNSAIKLIGNGIFLTQDITQSPITWQTGITGEGINASAITGGNIDTKQISIWNASEGQIRFAWNDEGLFAYGDKFGNGSSDDLINYSTYVKFNQEGLDFSDDGRSALKLGWDGLKISTQNNSLVLDANKGLVLNEWNNNTPTTRLELGKLDGVYGLKLYNKQGKPTFQSDSDGDLWLSEYINIGGEFDGTSYSVSSPPTAGISGITTSVTTYQMGVMRSTNSGEITWNPNPLRFWAGPQTKEQYLQNLSMTTSDLPNDVITKFSNLPDKSPSLSRFKVDSDGNIIASGIDVGGWIGAGKILRSNDWESVLRSNEYIINNTAYPVLAVGKFPQTGKVPAGIDYYTTSSYTQKAGITDKEYSIEVAVYANAAPQTELVYRIYINDIRYYIKPQDIYNLSYSYLDTTNYNFRLYKNGGINIGRGAFKILPNGAVTASSLTITGGSISSTGININNKFIVDGNTGSVTAGDITITGGSIVLTGTSTQTAIDVNNSVFKVTKDGAVTAGDITITGSGNRNWIIDSEEFQVSKEGYVGAGVIPVNERPTSFDTENYDFSVYDGNIRFKGDISAYYDGEWYNGLDQEIITVTSGDEYNSVTNAYRVVKGLIVSRTYINA